MTAFCRRADTVSNHPCGGFVKNSGRTSLISGSHAVPGPEHVAGDQPIQRDLVHLPRRQQLPSFLQIMVARADDVQPGAHELHAAPFGATSAAGPRGQYRSSRTTDGCGRELVLSLPGRAPTATSRTSTRRDVSPATGNRARRPIRTDSAPDRRDRRETCSARSRRRRPRWRR